MKPLALIPLSLLIAFSSCGQRRVRGGGASETQTRNISAFTTVEIAGSEDVEFLPATTPRIEVMGYKNLLPYYKTTVKGGVLSMSFEGDNLNINNSNLRVRVYSPGVTAIGLAGSGDVTVHPGATTLVQDVELAGSGDITINQTDVDRLALEIAGSGSIKARNARAATVKAEIAGSGDIETTATSRLEAEVAGSGNVHYWGGAQVSKDVAGSGDVVGH